MTKQTVPRVLLHTLPMVIVVVSGCSDALSGGPSSSQSENGGGSSMESELEFDVEPPRPAAVDTEVPYGFSEVPGRASFESLSVEPDSDAVEVTSKSLSPPDHPSFSLRASETGTHPVQVHAQLENGGELERTFEMDVREYTDIAFDPLGHEPQDLDADQAAPYLVDSEAHVSLSLVDPGGEALAGTVDGVDQLVDWKPKGALSFDESASEGNRLVFQTGSEPGVVTLQSTLGSKEKKIELITPSMVEDIALAEFARLGEPDFEIGIEGFWGAHVVPVYDDVTIIDGSLESSLESETPEVCAVVSDDRSSFEEETGREVESLIADHWPGNGFVVDIRGAGECRLHAEFPEANGGSGAELQESFQIAD